MMVRVEHLQLSLLLLRARKITRVLKEKGLRRAAKLGVFPSLEVEDLLPDVAIDLILDVGANRGQFALLATGKYKSVRIVCFEPGRAARGTLHKVLRGVAADTMVCPFGLGAEIRSATLYVTEADDSSSLLKPSPLQEAAHRDACVVATELIDVRRGDEVIDMSELTGNVLLKLDIQGAELEALRGMGDLMKSIDYVLVELSLSEMYTEQSLAAEVVAFLHSVGFRLQKISKAQVFGQQQTQFDALFRLEGVPDSDCEYV